LFASNHLFLPPDIFVCSGGLALETIADIQQHFQLLKELPILYW